MRVEHERARGIIIDAKRVIIGSYYSYKEETQEAGMNSSLVSHPLHEILATPLRTGLPGLLSVRKRDTLCGRYGRGRYRLWPISSFPKIFGWAKSLPPPSLPFHSLY